MYFWSFLWDSVSGVGTLASTSLTDRTVWASALGKVPENLNFSTCPNAPNSMLSMEQAYGCVCGCAWMRSSGFKCKVLPAAT